MLYSSLPDPLRAYPILSLPFPPSLPPPPTTTPEDVHAPTPSLPQAFTRLIAPLVPPEGKQVTIAHQVTRVKQVEEYVLRGPWSKRPGREIPDEVSEKVLRWLAVTVSNLEAKDLKGNAIATVRSRKVESDFLKNVGEDFKTLYHDIGWPSAVKQYYPYMTEPTFSDPIDQKLMIPGLWTRMEKTLDFVVEGTWRFRPGELSEQAIEVFEKILGNARSALREAAGRLELGKERGNVEEVRREIKMDRTFQLMAKDFYHDVRTEFEKYFEEYRVADGAPSASGKPWGS